jgi:hypothetical protein
MIPQIGYMYTYDGTCFITLAMDDVNEQDLEEYDPDLVEKYDRPDSDDDGEVEVIKKDDPRYRTRTLVYFTPDRVMAHGQLSHSPEFRHMLRIIPWMDVRSFVRRISGVR